MKKQPKTYIFKRKMINLFNIWIGILVLYILMNFSAYSQIIKHKLGFSSNNHITVSEDTIDSIDNSNMGLDSSENLEFYDFIPKINLSITPPDNRIYIPRINKNVPIIDVPERHLESKDFLALEKDIQHALKDGVVHYPGTAKPSDRGNFVVTGHSSYFPWDSGRFKDVFALLHDININDEIIVFYNQIQYKYKVTAINSVYPEEVNVLAPKSESLITLITCTPLGTNLKRLIITAEEIPL